MDYLTTTEVHFAMRLNKNEMLTKKLPNFDTADSSLECNLEVSHALSYNCY